MAIMQMIDYYLATCKTYDKRNKDVIAYRVNKYRCSNCGAIITLPEQQNFSYCMHCGKRIKIADKDKLL